MNRTEVDSYKAVVFIKTKFESDLEFVLRAEEDRRNDSDEPMPLLSFSNGRTTKTFVDLLIGMARARFAELELASADITESCVYGDVSLTVAAADLDDLAVALAVLEQAVTDWIDEYAIESFPQT